MDARELARSATEPSSSEQRLSHEEAVHERGGVALDWRRWLSGASPREVLARIVPGDPLGLRLRIARALEERALLLDADRVRLAALARVARAAPRYRGHPEPDAWLADIVGRTLDEIVRGSEPGPEIQGADAFDELAPRLGLDPAGLRRASAVFHRLPLEERRAFFELVLEQRSLDDLARERAESASAIARRARRALLVVLEQVADHDRADGMTDGAQNDSTAGAEPAEAERQRTRSTGGA